MNLSRAFLVAAAVAASTALADEAAAQGFFERLFGIQPAPAPLPPASVPQGPRPQRSAPVPASPDEGAPTGPPRSAEPVAPAPPKPVVLKPPSEDSVVGRDLKLNGTTGSLRIERAGASDLRAQISLQGAKVAQPTEACSVKLGGGEPVPLSSAGRPDGLPRYELQAPMCPIVFEVLDGAVLVTGPAEACVIREENCRVEPRGVWGPEPGSLIPKAREIEQARGTADRAVRENYKALTQRAGPQGVRPIVSEQAAFSSEREQLCHSYAREGAHGFCNARFTEARAVTLASRLGLTPAAEARSERPRRSRPPPVSAANPEPAPGSDAPYIR